MIPYGRQSIVEADIEAVVDVLRSDFLTQGPVVPRFEQSVAEYCGAAHGVAVNSATSALHVACLALGLGEGDRLWTSPITFVASANAARYCGARVDFVDIDAKTYNMSVTALAAKLEQAERDGTLPKIVMPVHFAGQPCDMPAIAELAQRYGFRVIEDASHAIGAGYGNVKVGACAHSDIAVFSFHPVKIITTGEGGLATTNDPQIARHMERLRSHGITRDPEFMTRESDGPWYYQQLELGWNYRMTDMQAALGLSQLTRLNKFIMRRREIVQRYASELNDLPLYLPATDPGIESSWHLYVIRLHDSNRRRRVIEGLLNIGVGANVHYIPVHLQPYYQKFGFQSGDFPAAEDYYERAVSLPLHPCLSDSEMSTVIDGLRAVL